MMMVAANFDLFFFFFFFLEAKFDDKYCFCDNGVGEK
jgi:hypothetical protein